MMRRTCLGFVKEFNPRKTEILFSRKIKGSIDPLVLKDTDEDYLCFISIICTKIRK